MEQVIDEGAPPAIPDLDIDPRFGVWDTHVIQRKVAFNSQCYRLKRQRHLLLSGTLSRGYVTARKAVRIKRWIILQSGFTVV